MLHNGCQVLLLDTIPTLWVSFGVPEKSCPSDKQQIGARVDASLIVEVRVIAARQRRRFNELIEEALQDLLKKYREKRK